jgi:translation initiation factor 1
MAGEGKKTQGEGWSLVRRCPRCGREEEFCACRPVQTAPPPASKQRPKFRLEKRRGKPVTVITHLTLKESELKDLAGKLKGRLGTGGTAKGGEIELQGDHRGTLPAILREFGFKI